MKDTEADIHLMQHLSGEPPREAFEQEVLRASTAEFQRGWRQRRFWRRAAAAAAVILIAGAAFFGGQLSVTHPLAKNENGSVKQGAEPDGVTVPREVVTWLEAARFFGQLGMEDRMARAVERAGRLLPGDAMTGDGQAVEAFLAAGSIENPKEFTEPMGKPGPNPSTASFKPILAKTLGD